MRRFVTLGLLIAGCGGTSPQPAPAAGHQPPAHRGPLVHRFEKAEDWVKIFEDPARDEWQKPTHVVALLGIPENGTVVDLGTGTGYFLPHLSKAAGKVLALDVEPDMIRYVKERIAREKLGNVEARVVALDDPGLADASVDRVLAVDVWHHVPSRVSYAKKLARALREGGALFVVDFTMDAKHGPPKHHRLLATKVAAELSSAGLNAQEVPSQLEEQWVVVGRR